MNAGYGQLIATFLEDKAEVNKILKEKTLAYRTEFDAFTAFLIQNYSTKMGSK